MASEKWRRYDPNPPLFFTPRKRVRLIDTGQLTRPDPMADYIEDAEWWLARSNRTVKALQRAYDQQEVACVLYERVGAMFATGRRAGKQHLIAIQLVRTGDDWDLDLALSEAGVYLEEQIQDPTEEQLK